MAILAELNEILLAVGRAVRQRVTAGSVSEIEMAMVNDVARGVRRTVALRQKLFEDSGRTEAERRADRLRRIDAEMRARLRQRRDHVLSAVDAEIRAYAERRGMPGEAERLMADLRERVVDADIARADTPEAVNALILGLCKDMEITPRNEIWSLALMRHEVSATKQEIDRVVASFPPLEEVMKPPPPREKPAPRVYPKIGPFTFGPTGEIIHSEVPLPDWVKEFAPKRPDAAEPEAEPAQVQGEPAVGETSPDADTDAVAEKDWAELISDGRTLPDLLKSRGPPPDDG
jgi:hypothetical protein